MQAVLERHSNSKLYPKSITKHRAFLGSRKVLEGKVRKIREGRGKRPNRAKSLTNKKEQTLWKMEKWSAWKWKSASPYYNDVVVAGPTPGRRWN